MLYHHHILSFSLILLILTGCWTHPSVHPKALEARADNSFFSSKKEKVPNEIVFFDYDSFNLVKPLEFQLDSLINKLQKDEDVKIEIIGHACEKGSRAYNRTLGQARAVRVSEYLIQKGLRPKDILKISSLGEEKLLCSLQEESCQYKNRRVEIKTIYADDIHQYKVIDQNIKILKSSKSEKDIRAELTQLHQIDRSTYTIGSGDRFDVYVYGEPELTVKGGVVKSDGTLSIIMVGDVKVSELSVNEAMKKVANRLKEYMIEPIVTLIPSKFGSKSYTILGKIDKPGTYPIGEKTRVLDSIANAEGLSIGIFKDNTIELADLEHAFIRRGTDVLPVNFIELIRKGNPLHNIPVQDKDYIYIPSALNTEVYILGEIKEPGFFGYREHLSISQLISYAEGYKISANITEIAVIRGTRDNPEIHIVNLESIMLGKEMDFMLKPFDLVFIPSSVLGDWNSIMRLVMPSFEALTGAYIAKSLIKGD